MQYFVLQYPKILTEMNMDCLNEQFLNYQLLKEDDITTIVRESVGLGPDDPHQLYVLWGYLKGVRKPGSSTFEFELLFKVAELVMTIPHSNAGEERIFSLINKNKTPSRSSMKLNGTLSSLIPVKAHVEDRLKWEPSDTLLRKAKKATKVYNDKHKN